MDTFDSSDDDYDDDDDYYDDDDDDYNEIDNYDSFYERNEYTSYNFKK